MNKLWIKLPKTVLWEKPLKVLMFVVAQVNYPNYNYCPPVVRQEPTPREIAIERVILNRDYARGALETVYEQVQILPFVRNLVTKIFSEGVVHGN